MRNRNIVTVWAWQIKEGLCRWVESYPDNLKDDMMPSPEGKKVKCILMTYKEYLKLKRKK